MFQVLLAILESEPVLMECAREEGSCLELVPMDMFDKVKEIAMTCLSVLYIIQT
jgi:hypothetical protein